jgi:uncharacterized protein YbgA (DUF1722 family)/uncharacterized protein YbbK (DUF523 family)
LKRKPLVFLSKCIEHGHCRYDGSQTSSIFIKKLEDYVDFVMACPEVEIGLPVPREAIRIIKPKDTELLVSSQTGVDVTEKMEAYSKEYVSQLKERNIHGFILKSRSPSCGIKDVKTYKTFGKAPSTGDKTTGFFGRVILENYQGYPIEDEGRLMNYNIREHFLTQIYTLMAFDEVLEKNTMKALIDFHSKNKYLLMAYHQMRQRELGKIVANHENKKVNDVINSYADLLRRSLEKPLRRGTNINMLMHLFGYFKKDLSASEKAYFLDTLEKYHMKKVPFSVPIAIIHAWVIRFDEKYLKQQTIFEPYPSEILDVNDSGKGID